MGDGVCMREWTQPLRRALPALGAQLFVGGTLVTLTSLILLDTPVTADLALAGIVAACAMLDAAAMRFPGKASRQTRRAIGAVITLLALATTGFVPGSESLLFGGCFTAVFVYAGLRLPRRVVHCLLPVATLCWLATNQPITSLVIARLPVAAGIWLLVGDLLSRNARQAAAVRSALEAEASIDPLTGLLNRKAFEERLAGLNPSDAIVFVDLDHFKAVNDTFGHQSGDRMLTDLGRVVLSVLRSRDTAIRYGGEEILLLLHGAGRDGAERVLNRLKTGWTASHPESTFSAGVAIVGELTGAEAVVVADRAVYEAKAAGRNRWVFHTDAAAPTHRSESPPPDRRLSAVS